MSAKMNPPHMMGFKEINELVMGKPSKNAHDSFVSANNDRSIRLKNACFISHLTKREDQRFEGQGLEEQI